MINLSVRQYNLKIDALDCTPALISFSGCDSKADQTGLIIFKGSLTLGRPEGFESIDDRISERWARGNLIELLIANGAQTLKKPPRGGTLYILDSSYSPTTGRLEIQFGDILELLRFREPKGDKSKICLGTKTARTKIINNLLEAAGAPLLIDEVPGFLNAPMPRLLESSYIEQAGAIAAAAGYFLWVDTNGNVRASAISVNPVSPAIAIATAGIAVSERVAGEMPPAAIKVKGRATVLRRNGDTTTILTEEYGPAYNAGANSGVEIITKRTLKKDQLLRGSSLRIVETTVWQPAGIAFPDDPAYQGVVTLIITEHKKERFQYESNYPVFGVTSAARCQQGNQGRLKRYESLSEQPAGSALRDVYSTYPKTVQVDKLQLILAEQVITRYAYEPSTSFFQREADIDPDEVWIPESLGDGPKIVKQIFRPVGAIVPSEFRYKAGVTTHPGLMVECERETQYWRETSFGEWRYSKDVLKSVALTNPSLADTLRKKFKNKEEVNLAQLLSNLTNAEQEEIVSNAGQAQPPAPDSYQPEWSTKDVSILGKAKLPINSSSPYRQPARDLSFEYLSAVGLSEASARQIAQGEANRLAQVWGVLLWGKYKCVNYLTDLQDDWWSYTPLSRVDVQEPGTKFAYLGDGWSLCLAGNRCAVGFDGLLLGQTVTPLPNEPSVIDPITGNPVTPIVPIYKLSWESEISSSSAFRSRLRTYQTTTPRTAATQVASASAVQVTAAIGRGRVSGGIKFGGFGATVNHDRVSISGGVRFGGFGATTNHELSRSSGGIKFGGSITAPNNETVSVSGGIKFGGSVREMPRSLCTGGIKFGGTVSGAFISAVGGIKFGGSVQTEELRNVSGGIKFGGTAQALSQRDISGGIRFGGTVQVIEQRTSTGGIKFGGSVQTEEIRNVSGGIKFGGGIPKPDAIELGDSSSYLDLGDGNSRLILNA